MLQFFLVGPSTGAPGLKFERLTPDKTRGGRIVLDSTGVPWYIVDRRVRGRNPA